METKEFISLLSPVIAFVSSYIYIKVKLAIHEQRIVMIEQKIKEIQKDNQEERAEIKLSLKELNIEMKVLTERFTNFLLEQAKK